MDTVPAVAAEEEEYLFFLFLVVFFDDAEDGTDSPRLLLDMIECYSSRLLMKYDEFNIMLLFHSHVIAC